MKELNERWVPKNQLTMARDRHRLGDVNINFNDHRLNAPTQPMVRPMVGPMSPSIVAPLVRRMGQTTIQQRTQYQYGNPNLWAGTPVAGMPEILGDPEIIDVGSILKDFVRVGWTWDRKCHCLTAYLTLQGGKTYLVRIPLRKLQKIFNDAAQVDNGVRPFREKSLDGFFKKLGQGLKKAAGWVGKTVKNAVTAPVRFVKNPRQFVHETARKIKNTVKDVGKTVVKVASSPVFAGIMTGISAIPPLTAVGGAGLAAYAAAKAAKPALNAIGKGADLVSKATAKRGGSKGKSPVATAAAIAKTSALRQNLKSLPGPARNLMAAALRSESTTPESKPGRADRRKTMRRRMRRRIRNRYRLKQGQISRRAA